MTRPLLLMNALKRCFVLTPPCDYCSLLFLNLIIASMYQGSKHLDKAAERSGGFKNLYVSFMLVRQSRVTTYI